MRLAVDAQQPEEDVLEAAARVIGDHGIVAFPTETFYGLATSVFDRRGCARVFELKGRSSTKALPCIVSDVEALVQVAREISPVVLELAARFWPGPLTVVLPARASVVAASVDGTIAVRVSSLPLARALAVGAGPITATSANRSGAFPAQTADDVESQLGDDVELLLDGGTAAGGLPSTIVAVGSAGSGRDGRIELIREGAIPFRDVSSR
jgi:L-threonylcarbamoyladenylate synthase